MNYLFKTLPFALLLVFSLPQDASAWGKRGHEIVTMVAAKVLSQKEGVEFLSTHSYDLGYYSNVPDLVWRALPEEISKKEGPQHYVDWEYYSKKFSFGSLPKDLNEVKTAFGEKFKPDWGLAPWRIQQFNQACSKLGQELKAGQKTTEKAVLHKLQEEFLICIGTMAHYVGDLSMPLHTTTNHDGQFTKQKGVHAFFETVLVDHIGVDLHQDVERRALKLWERRLREAKGLDTFQYTMAQIAQSHSQIPELLKIDKSLKRDKLKVAAARFKSMLTEQMAESALCIALQWKELVSGIKLNEEKFYNFSPAPAYRASDFEGE